MRKILSLLAVVSLVGMTSSSFSVPSFARQTGYECTSCHASAGFPTLTKMGADFKGGSYSDADEENLMGDGEYLSIPKNLPLSFVLKVRANKIDDGVNDPTTELDSWDEAVIFIGGKLGKNSGYVMEWGEGQPLGARFSFGVVANDSMKAAIVVFMVDGWGPGGVFEAQSTGMVKNIRVWEERKLAGASFMGSLGSYSESAANGVGAYVYTDMGYLAVAGVAPGVHHAGGAENIKLATYIRGVVTPMAGLGVGFSYLMGHAQATGYLSTPSTDVDHGMMTVDVQYMANVGVPILAMFTYASATAEEYYGAGTTADAPSYMQFAVDAQLMQKLNAGIAYSSGNPGDGSADTRFGIQVKYAFLMNARLQLEHQIGMGDNEDSKTQLMLFGAF